MENAFVGVPAEFTIETKNAGPGNLGLTIEGPEEAKIDCADNGDGTCSVTYYPTQPGTEFSSKILKKSLLLIAKMTNILISSPDP